MFSDILSKPGTEPVQMAVDTTHCVPLRNRMEVSGQSKIGDIAEIAGDTTNDIYSNAFEHWLIPERD